MNCALDSYLPFKILQLRKINIKMFNQRKQIGKSVYTVHLQQHYKKPHLKIKYSTFGVFLQQFQVFIFNIVIVARFFLFSDGLLLIKSIPFSNNARFSESYFRVIRALYGSVKTVSTLPVKENLSLIKSSLFVRLKRYFF